jgi:TonB family protein
MKVILFLSSSILLHGLIFASLVFGGYSLFPKVVQKGSGSIEVEIVIPGQEGSLNFAPMLRSDGPLSENDLKEFVQPPEDFKRLDIFQRASLKESEKNIAFVTNEDIPNRLLNQVSQKAKIPHLVVFSPHDPGSITGIENASQNPAPQYPKIAILKGWEGETVARISVNSEGKVSRIFIAHSSGYSALDKAVFETLQDWQFEKGKTRHIEIPFKFELKNTK